MKRKYILKGKIVQIGNFLGKVKIINDPHDPEEFVGKGSRRRRGQVLVLKGNEKDMVSLVVKAGGVITDRERINPKIKEICQKKKIPCIIGTKKASKLLEDGMFAEINGLGRFGKIYLLDHPDFKSYKQECQIRKVSPNQGAG